MSKTKHPVVVIDHIDTGETVYCWGAESGVDTIASCLSRGELITVDRIQMTEKQYDALDEYDGDC